MHREHLDAMREATALTRAGRLAEATALIQRTLGGAPAPAPVRVVPGEIVIDEERLRDDHSPGAPPGREGSPDVDGGTASHVPGPRCTTGGLRELLRGQLAKVADGVRTHLPPSALAHGGPAGAPTFSGPLSGVRDGLGDLPGLDKLRDLLGSPRGPGAGSCPGAPERTGRARRRHRAT